MNINVLDKEIPAVLEQEFLCFRGAFSHYLDNYPCFL